MIKAYHDAKFNFNEIFDTRTGMYVRSGVLDENGKDTNVDPFMRSFPGLIDVGIMSSCTHGRTGLCAKAGIQCYQNGLNQFGPNMTLENYKRIILEGEKHGLFQCLHEDEVVLVRNPVTDLVSCYRPCILGTNRRYTCRRLHLYRQCKDAVCSYYRNAEICTRGIQN